MLVDSIGTAKQHYKVAYEHSVETAPALNRRRHIHFLWKWYSRTRQTNRKSKFHRTRIMTISILLITTAVVM